MQQRDPFDEIIHRAARGTDRPSRVIAVELLAALTEDEMAAFDRWLRDRAVTVLADTILQLRQSMGSRKRSKAGMSRFADAAAGFTGGDIERLSDFQVEYNVAGRTVALGDMTAPDHALIGSSYQKVGVQALMLAAVHRQVARRLGPGERTADVFTPQTYALLFGKPANGTDGDDPFAELLSAS